MRRGLVRVPDAAVQVGVVGVVVGVVALGGVVVGALALAVALAVVVVVVVTLAVVLVGVGRSLQVLVLVRVHVVVVGGGGGAGLLPRRHHLHHVTHGVHVAVGDGARVVRQRGL